MSTAQFQKWNRQAFDRSDFRLGCHQGEMDVSYHVEVDHTSVGMLGCVTKPMELDRNDVSSLW